MYINFKSFKSWGIIVFSFLVILRATLWLSVKWPSGNEWFLSPNNNFVKINNLPIHFLVHWPDSGRYWPSSPNTFSESLSLILHDTNRQFHLTYLFFLPFRLMTGSPAYGVLAQNILSLISAWMLFLMLRPYGRFFAAFSVFISFANILTISMEYALLREVLLRFLLILLLYLVWRMVISPNWKLAIAAGVTLFLLPLSRPEFIIIIALMLPVLFWRFSLRYAVVIILMGILGVYAFKMASGPQSRHLLLYQLQQNLLVGSYNYDSPRLKDLPKKIYAVAIRNKELDGVYSHYPSIRYQGFEDIMKGIIEDWKRENMINDVDLSTLFLDVLKNNTKYVIYSALYSFWSFMTGNLLTVSPLIYSGNDPNYKFAWPYYTSTNLIRFNDPVSELNPNERGPRWLTVIMAPFSEYWLRKICAPFFFIGLFYIGRMLLVNRQTIQSPLMVFWILVVLWTVTVLVVMCFIGIRGSKFIFAIDPFIFTISVLGMKVVGKELLNYRKYKKLILPIELLLLTKLDMFFEGVKKLNIQIFSHCEGTK